jgi:hypothetical protein
MKTIFVLFDSLNRHMLGCYGGSRESDTRLYDLLTDPGQAKPLHDSAIEARRVRLMRELMVRNEAPPEAFSWLALRRD